MRQTLLFCALLGAGMAPGAHAQSQVDTLTAARVVALARVRAPQVRVAESDVVAARGRLSGARALARENPTLEGTASTESRFEQRTQWELSVPIGIGLHWLGRVGVAGEELRRDQHLVGDARRGAVGAALAAYYRVLHAARRVELAGERRALAADLLKTATERHRAGEVPRLELLVAETEEARAESEFLSEQQSMILARIHLAATLGLPSIQTLVVAGDLANRSVLPPMTNANPRSDVLAAERELRAAKAARHLARTELLPGLAFRLHYGHEGGEPRVQPGLAVTVPLFQYGQEGRQLARARETRAEAELERVRNAASSQVDGLRLAYDASMQAADQLGTRGLPRVQESDAMAREGYRAGKIDLPSLLVLRRELLDARREYADRLLEAAMTGIDLAVAEGTFQ